MAGAVNGMLDIWGQTHDIDEHPGEVADLGVAPVRWRERAQEVVRQELARVAAERATLKAKIDDLRSVAPAVGTPAVLRWTDPDLGRKTRVRKAEGTIEAITPTGIRVRANAGYRVTCTWADLLAQQANLRTPAGALLLGGPLRRDAEAAGA